MTVDIEERQQLNTAISAMMELVNEIYAFSDATATGAPGRRAEGTIVPAEGPEVVAVVGEALSALVRMLAPFAPHTAEELWERLAGRDGLTTASWPVFDADVARADEVVVPVQVSGKVRGRLTVPVDITDADLEALALADAAVLPHLAGKTVKKVVVARGRLVSVVVG